MPTTLRLSLLLTPVLAVSWLTAQDAPKPATPPASTPAGSTAKPSESPDKGAAEAPDGSARGKRMRGFGGPPGGGMLLPGGEGSGLPDASADDGPKINGNVVEPFQFPNNSVADLLAFYERLTGMTLVKDTAIFDGSPISLVTTKQVDKAEAIRLVEATLLVNGYAIIADPAGKSARILPTRSPGAASMQFSQGVKFYTDPKDIPEGETLITYFMKLEHLTPDEAGQTLANHVGLNVYGRMTPVASPPGLLITESANIVRHLIGIREVIDAAPSSSSLVTKFIKLEYADAPVVAQIVQATLDAQAKDKQTKGLSTIRGQGQPGKPVAGAAPAPAAAAPAPGGVSGGRLDPSGQKTSTEPAAQVVADPRLNQILVVASPQDFTYVSSLIQEFDKPVEVPEPFERKLSYVFSVDVLSSLSDLLKDTSTGISQLPGGGTLNTQANQQPLMSSSSQLLAGRKSTNTRGATIASSSAGASSSDTGTSGGSAAPPSSSVADQLIPPQEDNAPISILVNKTRIIADPQSNTIFVMGSKEAVDKVSKLLDKLDKKPAQVYLATVIGELTLDKGMNYGIDYISKFNAAGQNGGFTSSFIQQRPDIITNKSITDMRNNLITSAFGPAAGFNVYGQISKSVDTYVNALETTNKFKVLSRPAVFALNNKKATITSGSVVPYPGTSTSTPTNFGSTVTTNVSYLQVVLKLEVVPLINPNNEVTLTIAQVNDTVTGTQLIVPNNVPIIGTEKIITTVTVPSGRTVVLGGLISETDKKATNGIPFVSRIPVLGNLLKNNISSTERKELLIFIQPQVVEDEAQLVKASANEDLRSKVGADANAVFPQTPAAATPAGMLPGEDKRNWFQRNFGRKTLPPEQFVNPLKQNS